MGLRYYFISPFYELDDLKTSKNGKEKRKFPHIIQVDRMALLEYGFIIPTGTLPTPFGDCDVLL